MVIEPPNRAAGVLAAQARKPGNPGEVARAAAHDNSTAPSAAPLGALRADAPPRHAYRRGSRGLALAIASDPDRLQQAVQEFESATSSRGHAVVVSIQIELWDAVTTAHSGGACSRLTPESYTKTVAVLRKAGYRSAMLIASAAKLRHIEAGHEWTQVLARHAQKAAKAVKRGIGPDAHSAAFPLGSVADLPLKKAEVTDNGPLWGQRLVVISCWLLLREVELSALAQVVSHA